MHVSPGIAMWLVGSLLAVLALAGGPAAEAAGELGLITGSERGTYYQFGLDLQRLVKASGLELTVYPSRGSIDNVYAVYQRPATQMGIVQSDVLAFVTRVQSDAALRLIAKKTKLVFPLYNEEVHLLGKPEIASFDDLADRRVAIGREGSGTYLTARLLFKVSEVAPKEMLLIDTDQALAELKAGRIDAMFYVAGAPVRLFTDGLTSADGLRFIPITNKSTVEFYPQAALPAGTYPGQAEAVSTIAVKAVLVSYDFRKRDCELVGQFAQALAGNLPWLVKNGHPKWKAVDLDAPLRGWEQYDCVSRRLGRAVRAPAAGKSSSTNPLMDAVKEMLSD